MSEETKTQHSSGEWVSKIWDYSKANPPHKALIVENGEKKLAEFACDFSGDNPYEIPQTEAEANAQLFVAARDLLEACKDGLKFLDSLVPFPNMTKCTFENFKAFKKILDDAIAKAEEV